MKPELVNNRVKRKEREKIMVTKDCGEKEQEIPKGDGKTEETSLDNTTEYISQQVRKCFF